MSAPAPAKPANSLFGSVRDFLAGAGGGGNKKDEATVISVDAIRERAHDSGNDVELCSSDMLMEMPCEPFDELHELTNLQRADGHFEFFNVPGFGIYSEPWRQWVVLLESQAKDANAVASTLAALVLLETRFASRRDEWQMIADKAERWLAKQKIKLPAGETSLKDWAKKSLGL